ncbi:hypothetical protein [Candidatus Spongiihabitans sp.]|uniref:hypothetical protein n=1 Tax=Candidatus Spongiihabitans sp. TaxID=3101308 RepID=UPI003C7B3AAA
MAQEPLNPVVITPEREMSTEGLALGSAVEWSIWLAEQQDIALQVYGIKGNYQGKLTKRQE